MGYVKPHDHNIFTCTEMEKEDQEKRVLNRSNLNRVDGNKRKMLFPERYLVFP